MSNDIYYKIRETYKVKDCVILHCKDGEVCGHIYAIGNYDISIDDFELGIIDVNYDDIESVAELDEESIAYYDEDKDIYRTDVEGVVRTTSKKYIYQCEERRRMASESRRYKGLEKTIGWKWLWLVLLAVVLLFVYLYTRQGHVTGSGKTGGHEYVDLGLKSGLLWATCNVGAEYPGENGQHYAPGSVKPDEVLSSNMIKRQLSENNGASSTYILSAEEDAATANWGTDWRMPTVQELKELIDGCTWQYTQYAHRNGYLGTSKTNANTIFLPAAGGSQSFIREMDFGCYGSSSVVGGHSYSLIFSENGYKIDVYGEADTKSVRAVVKEKKQTENE